MNILLQILPGALILLAVSSIVTIKRKYYTFISIGTTVVLFAAVAGLSCYIFFNRPSAAIDVDSSNSFLVGKYIIEEDYDSAGSLLNTMYSTTEYNETYTLYSARLEALRGSFDNAAVLYAKAHDAFIRKGNSSFPQAEYDYFVNNQDGVPSNVLEHDAATVQYLVNTGNNPADYGFLSPDKYDIRNIALQKEKQCTLILKNVNKELSSKKQDNDSIAAFNNAADLLLKINHLYNEFINDNEFDNNELKKIIIKFEELSLANSDILMNEDIRLAQLKALILKGSFKDIAHSANENAGSKELMVLSELYINGHIKNSDFNENFTDISSEMYDKVISQCEKVLYSAFENEPKQTRAAAKSKIAALSNENKHKVLAAVKKRITDTLDNTPIEDQSKLYLQLSKIDNFLGNSTSADSVMKKSMDKVSYCEDSGFTAPMYRIMEVMNGKDNSEAIKDMSKYVSQVMDNTLPIKIKQTAEENSSADKNDEKNFKQYFTNYISRKKAVINISTIDKTDFPAVKSKIQISSDSMITGVKLNSLLELYDCGLRIEDFKAEKLEYSTSRITLCCDVSGSMNNNVSDLKSAVIRFISDMNRNEFVSIVGFDNSIRFFYDFTDRADVLNEAAGKLGAYGGTDMYSALQFCMDKFPSDINANNIIILMTDGQDNEKKSVDAIKTFIGQKCSDKDITIYAIGLGQDVDTQYLETIARYGNGKFIYCNDADSLNLFYDFIHNQLSSQYILSYTAKNTVDNSRELKVTFPQENAKDNKLYYLVEDIGTSDSSNSSIISDNSGINLFGLNTKLLYKSKSTDYNLTILGEGFTGLDNISVALSGNLDYLIDNARIIDDTSISITVPSDIVLGSYDLVVLADGIPTRLIKELTIALPGKSKIINFGPYALSAGEIINEGNKNYLLRGNVTLNGFIRFKGDLKLEGDFNKDTGITLTDNFGSYISFNRLNSSGLAGLMSSKGRSIDFSPLGSFVIYNDESHKYDFDEYTVKKIGTGKPIPAACLIFEKPALCIYPDRIEVQFGALDLDIPFQKDILKYAGRDVFTLKADGKAVISPSNIALVGQFEYEVEKGIKNFSIMTLPLSLNKLETDIDTLKNNYSVKAMVGLKALKSDTEVGMKFAVKDGKFDTIILYADFDVNVVNSPVPVTLSDFGLGIEDMSKVEQGADFKNILLNSYITGQLDIAVVKVSAILPFLKKFLPDSSLIELDDTTAKCRMKNFALLFESDLKLFGEIKMGKIDLRIGNFTYDNYLLDIPEQDVTGLYVYCKQGVEWDTANLKFEMNGSHSLSVNKKFIGLWSQGIIDYDVNWFVINTEKSYNGNLLVGVHAPNNKLQFTIIIKGTDLKNNKQKGLRIDFKDGSIKPKMNLY